MRSTSSTNVRRDGDAGAWTLLLGDAVVLESPTGEPLYPGRKTAAVLAWLALAGATPRERLAELLWPTASDPRNSLRYELHVLRRQAPVLTSGDPLALADGIRIVRGEGDLLASFDYSELPELDEWLLYQRERRREDLLEKLTERAASLERDGRHAEALEAARQALSLDALSETACRRVMRLAYLAGDRAGALDTFRRFEERLARELGVRPLPETAALARDVARATVERAGEIRRPIPVAVDRPPLLAGREREWARMEEAWANGQVIYLSGPPGVGKTRLMHEFAASKVPRQRWNVFTARPGDMTAPYASQARAFRAVLDGCPGIELTPVMRRELSRLLPDLADEAPPPMTTLAEKNYFYATLAEVLILSGAWLDCWVADDWQFIDPPSLEMANYMFANVTPVATDRKGQRAICTFRTAEVGDAFHAFLADLVRGGIAIHIELPPLDAPAVERLLASTEVEGAQALAEPMHRFTGGNPLFVVETLKSLLESEEGRLDAASLRDLWPERVAQVFEERFRRLDPRELLLLRLLAIAQTDATPRLAATALEMSEERVATAQAALERARLIDGLAFSHDLVYEAASRATPHAMRAHLHRSVATALGQLDGPAARIAYHYEQAGDLERALPHYLEAAEDALVRGAFAAAAAWFEMVRDRDDDPERVARARHALEAVTPLLAGD
ncbi:MAG: BTAD domain-containing putative transcriptional regulator [Trueperaceae bacterium]